MGAAAYAGVHIGGISHFKVTWIDWTRFI